MSPVHYGKLSRREREIMDVVYARGKATAAEVRQALADPPSYSAVRATLRILCEKGSLTHEREGRRYLYRATTPRGSIRKKELEKLVRTFFDGSPEKAMAAILDMSAKDLSPGELERIASMIEGARKEGR